MEKYLESVFSGEDPLRSLFFAMGVSGLLYKFILPEDRRRDLIEMWQAVCRIYIVVVLVKYKEMPTPWPPWFVEYFRYAPFFTACLWMLRQAEKELPPETSAFDAKEKTDAKPDYPGFIASKKEDPLERVEAQGPEVTMFDFDMIIATAVVVLTFLNFFYLLLTNALMTVYPCALLGNIYPRMLGEYLQYCGVYEKVYQLIFGTNGDNKKEDDEKKDF